MDDDQEIEVSEDNPVVVFVNRVKFLIQTDDRLSVAECIGALYILAHELAQLALEDDNESSEQD